MPIREIREYMQAVQEGDATIPQRREILLRHREAVCHQIGELNRCVELLDYKLTLYGQLPSDALDRALSETAPAHA